MVLINAPSRASIVANSASISVCKVVSRELLLTRGSFGSSLGWGTSMTGTGPFPYFSGRDSGCVGRLT